MELCIFTRSPKFQKHWHSNLAVRWNDWWVLSHFSHIWLFMTPWTVALQSPLSMRFSRQEYWSGLPCPPLRDLPDPEIESACPGSLALQMHSLATEPPRKPLRMTGGVLKTTNARHSVLEILNSDSAWASGGFKVPKWLSVYESLRTLDLE